MPIEIVRLGVRFLDIGSGVGSALSQAMITPNIVMSVGVECETDIANQSVFKMRDAKSSQYR